MSEQKKAWAGFVEGRWQKEINVFEFIRLNYRPFEGDASFLAPATEATEKLWTKLQGLQKEERAKGGVLDKGQPGNGQPCADIRILLVQRRKIHAACEDDLV